MANHLLVFAERRDGELKKPSLETLSTAHRIADGGTVSVVAVGSGAAGIAPDVAALGAQRLYACEASFLDLYVPEAYAAVLGEAAGACGAGFVLMACTSMGKDLAPRVAARLDAGLLSDVVELSVGDGGLLRGKRPVYSGKAVATVSVAPGRTAMATLRPNVFPVAAPGAATAIEVVGMECPLSEDAVGVRTTRLEVPEKQELDVAEASIIVSGGRGLKGPEHFSLIRELADELGAAVGASRAVVDAGWIGHAHQVGQTGKVVSPQLYVACGISGAIQHLAGMSSSKRIVAINKDAEAPIFKVADYGIVGDLFEIVPQVIEELRKVKAS